MKPAAATGTVLHCINDNLEQMAKAIYDYWFVQFDFPNEEGKPFKSSGGEMVYNEELKRKIPKGFKKGAISDLGEVVGGSTPPREIEEYFTTNGTAWITPKDLSQNKGNKFIVKGELDVSDKGIKIASLNIMPKGTVLLSTRAPIGYLAISQGKVTSNQGFKSFIPNKNFSTEYIYYSIKNLIPTIENNAVGSTFKEISASTLKSIPICLPTNNVIKAYNTVIAPFFNKQIILENQNQKLIQLRNWLLPMLMNGQVTVK
jgi:type I restriction enzyme, S subunit